MFWSRCVNIWPVLLVLCAGCGESLGDGEAGVANDTTVNGATSTNECATPRAGWIWCDDFEQDRLARYFEYKSGGGKFARVAGVGVGASSGMRARYADQGVTENVGSLHVAFGRTPQIYFRAVDAGTANYREVYWRMYVKHQAGWTGGGADKLSRAMIFASSISWAQAMVAHVWSGQAPGPDQSYLVLDPASGTDSSGNLRTTTYNDANLRWLGVVRGATPLFIASRVGQWYCVEAHVKLNDAGQSNGVFELWINGALDAQRPSQRESAFLTCDYYRSFARDGGHKALQLKAKRLAFGRLEWNPVTITKWQPMERTY